VLQEEKLIKDRYESSCGLIKGKDGLPVVAIFGGHEKGMEIWNPRTKEVDLLWDEIPPEAAGRVGLQNVKMITVNDGSEVYFYRGFGRYNTDEIWKYTVESNAWTRYSKFYFFKKVFKYIRLSF